MDSANTKGPKDWTEHHRKCRSNGGTNSPRNISIVEKKLHESWHRLFWNLEPEEIAQVINQTWLDPDFEFVVQRR